MTALPVSVPTGQVRARPSIAQGAHGEAFRALLEAAAHALGVPWAALAVVEGERITLQSCYGFTPGQSEARGHTFAHDVAGVREPFIVEDVRCDERFARGLGRLGPALARAFAGAPIEPAGGGGGVLCVMDREPRGITPAQLATLTSFAGLASRQFEVHAALYEANAVRRGLSSLIEASPVAITTLDPNGVVLSWSPAAERLSGYAAGDVVGRFPPWVPGGRNNRDFRELLSAMRRGASYLHQRSRRSRADGTPVDIRIMAAPMFASDGSVMGFVAMSQDVDELERAERRLHLFEAAACKSSDAVIVTSSLPLDDPQISWVNEAFSQVFGYDSDEVVGKPLSLLHSVDAPAARLILRARKGCVSTRGTLVHRRKNGESFWCESSLSPVVEADGSCDSWVVIARDVTEQHRADRLQQDRAELLEMVAADAPMEEIFAALVASAERARPGAVALLWLRRGNVLIRAAASVALESLPDCVPLGDEMPSNGAPVGDLAAILGARGALANWNSPICAGSGDAFGTFAMHAMSDVAPTRADLKLAAEFARIAGIAIERHEDRQRLEFLAMHDALTGLPNRKMLAARLDEAIAGAQKRGRNVALGLIDLNRFKVINDSLGHAVGDQLLCDVAGRLARSVRPGDTIARLGGDEFVLLMDDLASREEALPIAERVLLALVPSFTCAGQEVFVRANMGLSTYPADADDASGLLALGDAAMYGAKMHGRDVAFYVRGEDRHGVARIALEASLNRALERGEFDVLYQPQVELRTRQIRGAEALLRWNNPAYGQLLPDTFVRIAEDTGLIVPIGAWVLEDACRFGRRWQDAGLDRFVAVNVSARQFDRPEFVELVTRTLAATGLEPRRLHLELTEGLIMRSPENAAATLGDLKALGVKIVIDDFGTGYSSFNYLKRFPLDALKIDRLFVRDIGFGVRASNDEAIVRAIVQVARALDLQIVAEGVENEDQVAFLRSLGVQLAQGFLFAHALCAAAALSWTQGAPRQ